MKKATIVALPGAGNCLAPWGEVRIALDGLGYQLVLVPLSGYKEVETVEGFVERLVSTLNVIQGPYVLMGLSMGALVAMVVASGDLVGSVSQLILLSPPMARSWQDVPWPVRLFLKTWPFWHWLGNLKAKVNPKDLQVSRGALEAIRTCDWHNLSWVMRYCIASLKFSFGEQIERLSAPTLIISGERDFWCRLAGAGNESGQLRDNQVHTTLPGGHALVTFDATRLAEEIVRFIEET